MDPQDAIELGRQAIWISLLIGAPVLLAGLVVGLVVGLLQALTQIQEQTVAFVPKLSASYEAPVVKDVTLGARAGLWVRWSTGSAAIPGVVQRLQGELVALVTWKVF